MLNRRTLIQTAAAAATSLALPRQLSFREIVSRLGSDAIGYRYTHAVPFVMHHSGSFERDNCLISLLGFRSPHERLATHHSRTGRKYSKVLTDLHDRHCIMSSALGSADYYSELTWFIPCKTADPNSEFTYVWLYTCIDEEPVYSSGKHGQCLGRLASDTEDQQHLTILSDLVDRLANGDHLRK